MVNAPETETTTSPPFHGRSRPEILNPLFELQHALVQEGRILHLRRVDSSGIEFREGVVHHGPLNGGLVDGEQLIVSEEETSSPLRKFSTPFRRARDAIRRTSSRVDGSTPPAAANHVTFAHDPAAGAGRPGGTATADVTSNGEAAPPVVNGVTVPPAADGAGETAALRSPARTPTGSTDRSQPATDRSTAPALSSRTESSLSATTDRAIVFSPPKRLTPLVIDGAGPAASPPSPNGYLAPPSPRSRSRSPPPPLAPLPAMRRSQTVGSSPTGLSPPSPGWDDHAEPHSPTRRTRAPQRTMSHGPHLVGNAASSSTAGSPDSENPETQFQDSMAKQADAIRRERAEKRLEKEKLDEKEQRDREKAVAARAPTPLTDKALKGNIVGEEHIKYVLMYNMLTGIRIGVSRCQAKTKRDIATTDYTGRHKFSFDIVGNELTPTAKYDFKFKDYAPWIFRDLREHFHLDPGAYLASLTAKYILSEIGSPGKSGSFFYFSRDYRFIIKTIAHSEHKFLLKILQEYHAYVLANPHTLLSRFYGLHRVKLPGGRKIHFVVMNNLFPPHRDIHETYDLKGSSQGRVYSEEKAKDNPGACLKDLNWVRRERVFELGPEKRAFFEEQLRRDVALLQRLNIMDYSLLVGIHDVTRGNRDNLREQALTTFQPETSAVRRRSTVQRKADATALRQAVSKSDPKAISNTNRLPDRDRSERKHFIFYMDEGGMRATGEDNEPLNKLYYLGIIDILTPYTLYKRFEHFGKSFKYDGDLISAIAPVRYGSRFLRFICSSIRGADKSQRPKMA